MQLSVLIIDKTFHQIVLESDNFYYGHNFAQEKIGQRVIFDKPRQNSSYANILLLLIKKCRKFPKIKLILFLRIFFSFSMIVLKIWQVFCWFLIVKQNLKQLHVEKMYLYAECFWVLFWGVGIPGLAEKTGTFVIYIYAIVSSLVK